MLCQQTDLCSGIEAAAAYVGPHSPKPPIPTSFRTMGFFSEPHLLALLTDYFVMCFLEVLKLQCLKEKKRKKKKIFLIV